MSHWLTRHAKGSVAIILAIFCAGLGRWLLRPESPAGAALMRASYDSYYAWFDLADSPPSNAPLLVVYIDLESYLLERQDPTKPWPRALHAELVRRLTAAGARAVVFDVVFDAPGPDAEADRAFADALRANGHAVLAGEMSVSSQSSGEGPWGRMTKLALPLSSFRTAAAAWGLGEVGVDDDFVARQHLEGRVADGEVRPSLTWATARMLGLSSVGTTKRRLASRWFHYYGPPFTLPHVGFSQALHSSTADAASFSNKVVFVGARPMAGLFKERRDEFRSPFHSWRERDLFMPGVEVHATQFLNLLNQDWLSRPPAMAETALVILAGLLFGSGLLWLRPVPATIAAFITGGAVVASAILLFRSNIWFPWLILTTVQIPTALGGSILFHSLEWYRTRRRLEAAKHAADARIREQAALIEKAHDAILVQSLDGKITYTNPSAERLYGWSASEFTTIGAQKLFADSPAVEARQAAMERGEWNGELRQQGRSGKVFTVESRWTLLRDETGQPRGLLIINSDVTEKKQLEAESLRMQRMEAVGALAGGMAHDLNNALAPVLMGAQLLRRDSKDDNARRILSLMETSTRRGADMVRQVLLFARGRQGDFERLDMRPLVKEMEKLARDTFPQNISVSSHIAADLWPVRGNATQLHQVLLNLCINARDAMPCGGSLSVAADNVQLSEAEAGAIQGARAGSFIVLMVSDTGTGIPAELLPKIFEPFFTTKPEGRGTGLGLSSTARIVKAHEGFINVQTETGTGTTFEIYLPKFELNVPQATTESVPPPRGKSELILVADDDEAVRELLRRSLEDYGYRVIIAANGAEAVSLFKQSPNVAALISDHSMPVMDGMQAAAAIRQLRPNLPILFLSGDGEVPEPTDDVHRARHLPKPIDLDSLLRAIRNMLQSSS